MKNEHLIQLQQSAAGSNAKNGAFNSIATKCCGFKCEKWSIKFNCNKVLRVRMCGFKCEKTERLIQLKQSAAGAGTNVRVQM